MKLSRRGPDKRQRRRMNRRHKRILDEAIAHGVECMKKAVDDAFMREVLRENDSVFYTTK